MGPWEGNMWVYRYGEISHIPTVSETSSCYTQYGIADLAQELSFGTVVLVEERFLVHHNVGRYRSQGCHTLTGG